MDAEAELITDTFAGREEPRSMFLSLVAIVWRNSLSTP
jgi:hypothetical protein